jgi:hypothetical protein
MQYKILLFLGLLLYIFSGSFISTFLSDNDSSSKEIQKEILINQKEIDVFEETSLEDIYVTQKKVKAWLIIISYEKESQKSIISKLNNTGHSMKHNASKMYYSLGPFVSSSHAKEESKKLKDIHGIKNTIVDFVF